MKSDSAKNELLPSRIQRALLYDWDPIGVQDFSDAHDEYDSYVNDVCQLLLRDASFDEMLTYLWTLETEHMGLRGERERTEAFARRVFDIYNETTFK